MAKDFFEEIGDAITKTAREISGRAEVLYGTQKLKNKISGEEKQIQKIMEELGKVLYRRYREGVPLDDLQQRLCEQIDQRMTKIEQYKEEMAGVRSKKVCPSCGTVVDQDSAFCHHCGAACTTKEKGEIAGSVIDGKIKEAAKQEEAPAWKVTTDTAEPEETNTVEQAEAVSEESAEKPETDTVEPEETEEEILTPETAEKKPETEVSGEQPETAEELSSEAQNEQSESVQTEEALKEKSETDKISEIPEEPSGQ